MQRSDDKLEQFPKFSKEQNAVGTHQIQLVLSWIRVVSPVGRFALNRFALVLGVGRFALIRWVVSPVGPFAHGSFRQ